MPTTKRASRPPQLRADTQPHEPSPRTLPTDERPTQEPPHGAAVAYAEAPTQPPPSVPPPSRPATPAIEGQPHDLPPLPPVETVAANGAGTAPSLDLPALAAGADDWQQDKRIVALWGINEQRNAWVSVPGAGWVRLADTSDATCLALTILAAHARQTQTQVNYRLGADGKIAEMYVW
jgi:hypothetical protein